MKSIIMTAFLLFSFIASSNDELRAIRQEIAKIKQSYESKIAELEVRLLTAESQIKQQSEEIKSNTVISNSGAINTTNNNSFNPAISLIFDGRYIDRSHKQNALSFPGFALGPETGLEDEGFNIGESELTLSANIDDKFYGEATIAFANELGETNVEVEELFFQTTTLGNGLTLKGGRFFSAFGYLNEQHAHAWDFADAPLAYQVLFGGNLANEGLQVSMILPTDFFVEAGIELGNGQGFPAGGSHNGFGSQTAFISTGGDIGYSHSWQLGLSYWQASVKERAGLDENPAYAFTGDSEIKALDFVYKWAPNGNNKQKNLKFQFEYMDKNEEGSLGSAESAPANFDGNQSAWYAQTVWQFNPNWRTGFRYDSIDANNLSTDRQRLIDAGLLAGDKQNRYSIMLEWIPSEFSRLRLQYNNQIDAFNASQLFFQYTYSMGSHGAHQF